MNNYIADVYRMQLKEHIGFKRVDGHVVFVIAPEYDVWSDNGEFVTETFYDDLAHFLERFVI